MPEDDVDAPPPKEAAGPAASSPDARPPEDWETRFKYLYADFENYRRRTERDREAYGRQGRAAILRDLLPLVEAFRSAHESAGHLPAEDPLRRGLDLLDREWSKFLKHQGIETVAELGAPFRSEDAEAVGEVPATDAAPEGTVAEVVQQGYRFFGGVLRPAKVIVARGRPPAEAAGAEDPAAPDTGGAPS